MREASRWQEDVLPCRVLREPGSPAANTVSAGKDGAGVSREGLPNTQGASGGSGSLNFQNSDGWKSSALWQSPE